METVTSINNIIRKFIYKHINLFMVFAVIMSFFVATLSFLAIIFFVWNLINEKAYPRISTIFLIVAVVLNVLFLGFLGPKTNMEANAYYQKWDQPGYHVEWEHNSQISLNFIEKRIEWYKEKHGKFPDYLNDIRGLGLVEQDFSYHVKLKNGEIGPAHFYYAKVDSEHYLLLGVGKDGKINTEDDLIPQITRSQQKITGLLRYKLVPALGEKVKPGKGKTGIQMN